MSEASIRYYNRMKARNLCPRCGNDTSENTLCEVCLESIRIAERKKYSVLSEEGICIQCKKEKARPGKKTCNKCAEKMKQYRKKYYAIKGK